MWNNKIKLIHVGSSLSHQPAILLGFRHRYGHLPSDMRSPPPKTKWDLGQHIKSGGAPPHRGRAPPQGLHLPLQSQTIRPIRVFVSTWLSSSRVAIEDGWELRSSPSICAPLLPKKFGFGATHKFFFQKDIDPGVVAHPPRSAPPMPTSRRASCANKSYWAFANRHGWAFTRASLGFTLPTVRTLGFVPAYYWAS